MIRDAVLAFLIGFILSWLLPYPAPAHEHWINQGGYKNQYGEWCCGSNDCYQISGVSRVTLPAPGYRLPWGEFVPSANTAPSEDGQYWRCIDRLRKTRCFFAPVPELF